MSAALALVLPPPPPALVVSVWLTSDAICGKAAIGKRSFQRLVARGVVISRVTPVRERNGRPRHEYLVSSLTPELQAKLVPPNRPAPAPQTDLGPLFPAPAARDMDQRVSLTPEEQRQATERLTAIRPLLEYADPAERGKFAALRLRDGRAVATSNLLADYVAETLRIEGRAVAPRTLWQWLRRYRTGGFNALARQPRSDKGRSSFFTRYPAAAALAAAEFHKPYATIARAYDAVLRDRELLQIPEAELPTYSTVKRFLDGLPKPLAILAREGQRAYNERCAPHLLRKFTDIPAGSIYVADHMLHDVECRNDCFPGVPLHAPLRLRFTCFMDLRSRKIVGYCWATEGDWRSIVTALRRAVERFGPPATAYFDNGSDYKKVARGAYRTKPSGESIRQGADELERQGALRQLNIAAQFCIPYSAQSKPIERAFGFVHGRLDAIFHTYLTGNSYNRPDAAILAGTEHRKLVKVGRGRESSLIPASIFIKLAETWIETDYNAAHRHSGAGMNGRTPNEVFDEGYPLEARRKADPKVLATLLYERRTCTVRRTAVTLDGRRYMPAQSSPESWAAIHSKNEARIVVAFDPLDPNKAIALDDDGYKLADLQAEVMTEHPLEPTEESRQAIAGMSQMRGRLRKATSIAVATMHEGVALAGHKSALQHLAERALNTVAVDELISRRVIAKATRPNPKAHAPASSFDIASEIFKDLTA